MLPIGQRHSPGPLIWLAAAATLVQFGLLGQMALGSGGGGKVASSQASTSLHGGVAHSNAWSSAGDTSSSSSSSSSGGGAGSTSTSSRAGHYRPRQAAPYDAESDWDTFMKSGLFVEPYEEAVHWAPVEQVELQRAGIAKSLVLFREVLTDALASRDNFAASTRLVMRWGPKLLARLMENRQEELALESRYEPPGSFFDMLADLVDMVERVSTDLKVERGYSKLMIDVAAFRQRVDAVFDHLQRIVDASPMGFYLKWNTARLYTDQPAHPLHNIELHLEMADLLAQFRAIGYESSAFFARRISGLLRNFARDQAKRSLASFH